MHVHFSQPHIDKNQIKIHMSPAFSDSGVMKLSVWLILVLSVLCFLQVEALIYYVSSSDPVDESCTVNGTLLRPCYSLQELGKNITLLHDRVSITLLFLPGKHVISQTFTAYNVRELNIHPWNSNKQVNVECQLPKRFIFYNVGEMLVFSFNFTACTIQHLWTNNFYSNQSIIRFDYCDFNVNPLNYSLIITNTVKLKLNVSITSCTFSSNNGAVLIDSSFVGTSLIITNSEFIHNRKKSIGSTVFASGSKMDISIYQSQFFNNTATGTAITGGAIDCSSLKIVKCLFKSNSGKAGGSISTRRLVADNCIFQDNFANILGGAIKADFAKIFNCHFENNSAGQLGGALHIGIQYGIIREDLYIANSSFNLNRAGIHGGAIYCMMVDALYFSTSSSNSNFAVANGGFLYLTGCNVIMENDTEIINNQAENGGAIYDKNSLIQIGIRSERPWLYDGTPLTEVRLVNNTAMNLGGALYFENSKLLSLAESHLIFVGNTAADKGGAIYVCDNKCEDIASDQSDCFINIYYFTKTLFMHNHAEHGPLLYGGLLDRCVMHVPGTITSGINNFKRLVSYNNQTTSAITSDPVKVCLCTDDQPDCRTREMQVTRIKGQTVDLLMAVVDQDEIPVTSFISANYKETLADLDKGESRQLVYNNCTTYSYHVYTEICLATLVLQPEGPCQRSPLSTLIIHLTVINCTRGFEQLKDRCICDRRLLNYLRNVTCSVNALTISREGSVWFRYDEDYLKMSPNCPLDYCRASSDAISLLSPDEQCANQRSGVMCGACQDNHSIALGGSKCLHCTSNYTFIWLTLVFAVAGMALVALLLVCNITISTGTLNGLIFYANIVSISGLTSLQNCSIHPIFSVFIAWVNLDFGVETCFYPGMDTYQKTWLQFAFPLYIILLVVAILVACYYSTTAMKIFGRNNIAILATLFLLSYSKILKTIITALNSTRVLVSNADDVSDQVVSERVWTYDGSIDYLKGKHVALFTVALLLLLCLFLPYTLLLMFGQCIRSLSAGNRWVVRIIRSTLFISIIDAYHAPYLKRHRYWTGFMLLTRCLLFLAIATFNRNSDIATNMYITALIIIAILVLNRIHSSRIYKHLHLDMLELWFHLNLMVLSLTLCYLLTNRTSSESIVCKCTNASFGIIFITFSGILCFHAYLQLQKTRCFTPVKRILLAKWPIREMHGAPIEDHMLVTTDTNSSKRKTPTTTMVDLREELLASDRDKNKN